MKNSNQGFSLIEVTIVVAIVGILTAIAVPSYSEYVRRGHRLEARAGLLQAQQWLERAATATGSYPDTLPATLTWANDNDKPYRIEITQPASWSYTLTATRKSGSSQANDKCGDYTVTNTGQRDITNNQPNTTAAGCWDN